MLEFLKANWIELVAGLLAFAGVIVRLTPTEKDDTILGWIKSIFDVLIPNRKKGGGRHA
jgi:hypothetical protein